MIREVCLFDKFSFCKNGVRCTRVHLKEVCQERECDYRRCNKRHPRPCRIFRMNGFCRFGQSCRYSHRLPKDIEEQTKKINHLEKTTEKLLKQVADQDVIIKDLQRKLVENESRELQRLQKQIDDIIETNIKKEEAIKKLETDFEKLKEINCENEMEENEDIEETELNEAPEASNIRSNEYVEEKDEEDFYGNSTIFRMKFLEKLRNLKAESNKLRKNSTQQTKSKIKEFNKEMKKEKANVRIEYELTCLLGTFSDLENKTTDREELTRIIEEVYQYDY